MADQAPQHDEVDQPQRVSISGPVFFGSAGLILAFVIFGAGMPEKAGEVFGQVQAWITHTLGWYYLLCVAVFLLFALFLAVSSFGRIKLGQDHAEPDFSYSSWFAMLFSAGMGIGLMFFGVAEPVLHFNNPPVGPGGDIVAAREAMKLTFFHWGIHAWAIYSVVGLSLAYFSYRHGLPLTIRSSLYPLIGERIHGPIGHAVDIFAVLGTMFGIATSLGLGVLQINAGLTYLAGIPEGLVTQIILIAVITGMAVISVVIGLEGGIRRLSEINLYLALFLLVFVVVFGPTVFLLQALVQNAGGYVDDLIARTFTLYAYEPTPWLFDWTLFYWGWWIAWAPFVGMFIARISRGRTIREFVLGVLFVPTGLTFIWLTAFGNTAINLELAGITTSVSEAVADNVPVALFVFLEQFPLATLTSLVATLLVITFFVTSSDSGSLVIDTITSGGNQDPPVWQRIFWAVTEGVVAAVLLMAGGLAALQTASIAGALPFSAVMLVMCYGLYKGLRREAYRRTSLAAPTVAGEGNGSWQKQLQTILHYPRQAEVESFLDATATPALEAVVAELKSRGVEAAVSRDEDRIVLSAMGEGPEEFRYAIRMRSYAMPSFAYYETAAQQSRRERYYRAEIFLREGGQNYDVMGYRGDQLIADVLAQYDRHLHYLHLSRNV